MLKNQYAGTKKLPAKLLLERALRERHDIDKEQAKMLKKQLQSVGPAKNKAAEDAKYTPKPVLKSTWLERKMKRNAKTGSKLGWFTNFFWGGANGARKGLNWTVNGKPRSTAGKIGQFATRVPLAPLYGIGWAWRYLNSPIDE